jgi:Tol biopolymer transport system component
VDQWIVKPDGTGARKVMDGGGWAAWSSDSHWLYLSPPTPNGFRIEKVSVDGTNRQIVQTDGTRPAPGNDGILYYMVNRTSTSGGSDAEIRVARPDSAEGKPIARIASGRQPYWQVMQPVLSPSGKWLAVPLTDGPTTNVWGISTTDGQMRKITDFGSAATVIARRISWSSDGKWIFASVGKVEADIVLLSNLLPQ